MTQYLDKKLSVSINNTNKVKKKVKDAALDFTVRTGGADLRFLALQPGSEMGGWGPAILCFRTPFLFTLPRFLPGTHLELGRLWLSLQRHTTDPRPKLKNWVHRDSNPRPLKTRDPESSAPTHSAKQYKCISTNPTQHLVSYSGLSHLNLRG